MRWHGLAVLIVAAACGDDAVSMQPDGGGDSNDAATDAPPEELITYIKASNAEMFDSFGASVSMSADGSTLVVGATGEDGAPAALETDNSVNVSGAAYVFVRGGGTWTQQTRLKASNAGSLDGFGLRVAVSGDGNRVVVSAVREASASTDPNNNGASFAGAVYVFARSGASWTQEAYLKASNVETGDFFGQGLAISGDGSTIAVGASGEDSNATTIGGNQANNSAGNSGGVYIFTGGPSWTQQAYIKANNAEAGDNFGWSVALSNDGSTLVVGANEEDGSSPLLGGNSASNGALDAGAAFVYTRASTIWSEQAYIKSASPAQSDFFGASVGLSSDGNTLAVGASPEMIGNPGTVDVFTRAGTTWSHAKTLGPTTAVQFGYAVAVSGDGSTLLVGAKNANQNAGTVHVFTAATTWTEQTMWSAPNADMNDALAGSVSVSADGSLRAAGAGGEDSAATGINGNQADDTADGAGAAYVFR